MEGGADLGWVERLGGDRKLALLGCSDLKR